MLREECDWLGCLAGHGIGFGRMVVVPKSRECSRDHAEPIGVQVPIGVQIHGEGGFSKHVVPRVGHNLGVGQFEVEVVGCARLTSAPRL